MNEVDKEKVNEAFRTMRKMGLIARQNSECCGSCAAAQIAHDVADMPLPQRAKVKGAAFFHRQSGERAWPPDRSRAWRSHEPASLMVYFGQVDAVGVGAVGLPTEQVGLIVKTALEGAGLTVKWDGDEHKAIEVLPEPEVRS